MPNVIWKYELGAGVTELEMPRDAKILHVAQQHGGICMWAEVDQYAARETRKFVVIGTGHDFATAGKNAMQYLGTALLAEGTLVLHAYEMFPKVVALQQGRA